MRGGAALLSFHGSPWGQPAVLTGSSFQAGGGSSAAWAPAPELASSVPHCCSQLGPGRLGPCTLQGAQAHCVPGTNAVPTLVAEELESRRDQVLRAWRWQRLSRGPRHTWGGCGGSGWGLGGGPDSWRGRHTRCPGPEGGCCWALDSMLPPSQQGPQVAVTGLCGHAWGPLALWPIVGCDEPSTK